VPLAIRPLMLGAVGIGFGFDPNLWRPREHPCFSASNTFSPVDTWQWVVCWLWS